jgi:hypothetical protein
MVDASPTFGGGVRHVACLPEGRIGWAATCVLAVVWCDEAVDLLEFLFYFIEHHVVEDVCGRCLGEELGRSSLCTMLKNR